MLSICRRHHGRHLFSSLTLQTTCRSLISSSTDDSSYDYDAVVIGGGSGGLACSKEIAAFNGRVAVLDYVSPSPHGIKWGLGGTCVNVGCIPKKLMHQAALLGKGMKDASEYGWTVNDGQRHQWSQLVDKIGNHIRSLNWGHRLALNKAGVKYFNAFGRFTGPHSISATDSKGKVQTITAKHFIIAVGGRPNYIDGPGFKEYCITSDDLFSLPNPPGRTLVVGGSYIAMESAGFLSGLGCDTVIAVRSKVLRGFDSDMASIVERHMENEGVQFMRGVSPVSVDKVIGGDASGGDGALCVTFDDGSSRNFDTVLLAVGRTVCTKDLGLNEAGIDIDNVTGRIPTNLQDETNVPHIFAIGDVAKDRPELTPTAILAGRLLARRLYGGGTALMNWNNVPTTVFTPLEYGSVGLSEEKAIHEYGDDFIEVYHAFFRPLEQVLLSNDTSECYVKVIYRTQVLDGTPEEQTVIGFHFVGPNAGEVTQGIALAMKCDLRRSQLEATVGIHPTCAEEITKLHITKRSGIDAHVTSC